MTYMRSVGARGRKSICGKGMEAPRARHAERCNVCSILTGCHSAVLIVWAWMAEMRQRLLAQLFIPKVGNRCKAALWTTIKILTQRPNS